MKTKAKVILACENTGKIAVETACGDIAILELLGCEKIRLGDVLIGYWTELDNQVVYNESRDKHLDVFVHDHDCELDTIKKQYFDRQLPQHPALRECAGREYQPPLADEAQ